MKLVVVESPFAPKGRYIPTYEDGRKEHHLLRELEENRRYARLCMRDCLMRGEAPFASHILYTQEGVLDDTNLDERKRGMLAGFAWAAKADCTVVYDDMGISEDMTRGIKEAHACERKIEHRSLPGWDGWKAPRTFLDHVRSKGTFTSVPIAPVPKCYIHDCYEPAVHVESWYQGERYWCREHVPMSGHYESCGDRCSALSFEIRRRLFG